MNDDIISKRDRILSALLPDLAFEGWCWRAVVQAAVNAGFDKTMADALFPGRLKDAASHFSDWADRLMLEKLSKMDPGPLRVRDKIHLAVMTRFEILQPWKEAVRASSAFWGVPYRAPMAARIVWRTADRIWVWAGDTSRDYNYYTKRGLLSGILGSATFFWLSQPGDDRGNLSDFLDRRIESVMALGRKLGKNPAKR